MKKKLGIFVGEKGNWTFFREIFDYLNINYKVDVFKPRTYSTPLLYGRLNRWAFQNRIGSTIQRNDVNFFEWASELLVPASSLPKIKPIIARLHSYEINVWAPKINWNNVDRVILVSEAMKEKFCCKFPSHVEKAIVVNNGISLRKFYPIQQRRFELNIGMLCHIHPVKRLYEIILMVFELRSRGFNPKLHIAGGKWPDGYFDDYYLATKQLVEKLKLEDIVTFYGNVTDPSTWLQNIDIFLSNSYWEGQQVALLEAMACGCYCLSHFWDGVEEVLPPEYIFATENQLLQKIIAYSDMDENERQLHQNRMRAIACEKFDIEQTKTHIREIIEEVGNGTVR